MLPLVVEPIGTVRRRADGSSVLEVREEFQEGLLGIAPGDRIQVLYWMHKLNPQARRRLQVHPRGDTSCPLAGVFTVRSPMRPNPIGVSNVQVQAVEGNEIVVAGLDALDGSPVLDIKGLPDR